MVLTIVLGDIGSGKTLYLVYCACRSRRLVYSNFKLKIKNHRPLNKMTLLDIEKNCDCFLDEFYLDADARTPTAILNRYMSYAGLQQRKNIADFYASAQYLRLLDVRFQDMAKYIVKCEEVEGEGFNYDILTCKGKYQGDIDYLFLSLEDAEYYFDIYDTYEIIDPAKREFYRLLLLKDYDSPLFTQEALRIAKSILPKFKGRKITHPRLRVKLMEEGIPTLVEEAVYVYLQDLKAKT